MDPNDNAKYLNSPETELFDKGRSLYNHGPAREAAGKGQPLIVAEGYMDVIALAEAGLTPPWRRWARPSPKTSLRCCGASRTSRSSRWMATRRGCARRMRVIDLALPLLEAGKSLALCDDARGAGPG